MRPGDETTADCLATGSAGDLKVDCARGPVCRRPRMLRPRSKQRSPPARARAGRHDTSDRVASRPDACSSTREGASKFRFAFCLPNVPAFSCERQSDGEAGATSSSAATPCWAVSLRGHASRRGEDLPDDRPPPKRGLSPRGHSDDEAADHHLIGCGGESAPGSVRHRKERGGEFLSGSGAAVAGRSWSWEGCSATGA